MFMEGKEGGKSELQMEQTTQNRPSSPQITAQGSLSSSTPLSPLAGRLELETSLTWISNPEVQRAKWLVQGHPSAVSWEFLDPFNTVIILHSLTSIIITQRESGQVDVNAPTPPTKFHFPKSQFPHM